MKISVITPSFNQAQFLPFNLKSVASQQYPDVEHIIIDPGSTDGSTEIARAAGHAILIAEPDRGQSDGITKGFARATGDILTWLNSDDFYPSDQVLDLVARAFEQNSGIDVIYGKVNFVDDRGEFLRKGYVNSKAETLLESFHYQVGIVQPGLFMRRSVFEAVGGPSEQYEYCMDYEYWVRIASAGFKWKHVDEVLAHHRWWEGMKTSKGRDASLVEHMRVCSDYFGYIHWKWLDRYAEYLSSNKDGVVSHSTATDPDVKARNLRSVIERFVSQDMLRKLGHADGQQQRDTLDFIRKHAPELPRYYFNAEEISGMVESHPDPKATQRTAWHVFDGVDSKLRHYRTYKVPDNFHRAFDAKWYEGTLQSGRDKLRQLAERKKSDTCVIVANGPSLNNTDLSLLTDIDVIISNFATLNETLLKSATILTVTNTLVAEQADVLFNNLRTTKVLPVWLSHRINPTEETAFVGATVRPDFCTSLDSEFSWRSTVSYFNMQLAYALGYKRVLLIGFDHSYVQPENVKEGDRIDQTGDDHNHFDPRYFKGKTWQAADTGNMETVYKLAKAAFEADGREIINCTVGGHLEVFRRGDLASELAAGNVLPGRSGDAPARHPRMLVFDLTRLGDGTATGEIKRNVLGDWPKDRYMQVYNANGSALGIIRPDAETVLAGASDLSPIDAAVAAFRPEVILYRPVPDTPLLHKAAMRIIRENTDVPLVIWIMDDWIARLEHEDPEQFAVLDADWRALLASSSLRLSISEKMSEAMEARYGASFLPIANGVDPMDWPTTERPASRPFTIRYAGALADNMTAHSVLRVAQAVEDLANAGIDIQLEIQTKPLWRDNQADRYADLRRTRFQTDLLSSEEYRKWLSDADAVLIGYNFDAASLRYIGLSMANKMPECLASGAALIAHGPAEAATIAYLKQHDCALVVDTPDAQALAEAIRNLVNRPDIAASLVDKARQVAFENHNIFRIRSQLASALDRASWQTGAPQLSPAETPRTRQAHVDETAVVAHLLSARKGPEHVMLDVGAHFGTSAQYFDKLGWTIHCFEPDPKNREKLVARFGNATNVTIDPRAVSDKPATGVSFFSSDESTGISGLSAFRETHKESAKVDITTVAEIVRDRKITRVDFLKIDVEGFDFGVLKGVPWDRLKPDVVECEFEDAKTVPLGHTWKDIADFLRGQGYHVYVSEWHPIIRYGIPHDWRRVYQYPGPPMDSSAWGNFLAFREDPGLAAVQAAFDACAKFRAPKKASQPTKTQLQSDKTLSSPGAANSAKPAVKSGISAGAATNVNPPAPRTAPAGREQQTRDGRVNMLQKTPPNLLETPPPAGRMWYSAPAHRLRQVSPQLFTLLQFARRGFVHVVSRPHLLVLLLAAAGLAAWVGLDAQFAASRGWLLTGGALAALTLGLLYVAAKAQAHAAALHIEAGQIQAELAAMKALAAKTQQLAITEGQARSEAISSRIAQLQSELAIAKAASAKSAAAAAALSELRQESTKLTGKVATLDGERQKQASEIAKLSGAVAAIPQSLEPKLKTASDAASKLTADLASISQRVAALDGERQKQASEIAKLSGAVTAIPQSLEPKFKTSSDAASKLTADLASISQRVAALDGERQKLAAEIASLIKQIEAGKSADEALQKDLQSLKDQRAGIQTAVTETAEKVKAAESRLAHTEKWSRFNNAAWFQRFNRALTKEHTDILDKEWRRRLSVPMAPATLGYMANRACEVEARLEGRLATSIEDILLRSLVARAVKGKSVDVLEIGTLFATGAAIMFDALDGHYEDIHFTLLDPLEGYYHGAQSDILTGQRVNEHVVRKNLERAGMSEDQYTLIKHLSTEPEAMEMAARRKYDVLVIDGDHSYAGVKTDFENYASLVRVGGYIIFDDYNSPDWPDVKEYVDSELGDHPFVSPVGSSWRTSVFRVVKAPAKAGRSPSASRRKPASETSSESE